MQQNQAFELLKLGKNIFLTGAAGSGKTHLLNQYIQYLKENNVKLAITASTGIAATHLQGVTIHSWSGIGVKNFITGKDLEKLASSARIKRNYKKAKVLIIDEISMLHAHQLDMVDQIARFILEKEEPFGGMQVILCGDFFQLPPVSANNNGTRNFAFNANAWEQGNFNTCYLSEQYRQQNDPLLQVLNDIRSGNAGEHTKIPLRTRYKKEPVSPVKPTKLYSRNINVDTINETELANITGENKEFIMQTSGFPDLVNSLKNSCLAPEILKVKIGAEVMFIKNDPIGRYVNGTRAVVVNFDKVDGWPIVKTHNNNIIIAEPEEWKYEDNGIVRATLAQIPLRLAWAITIHKSQGMTLDAAEMDLGDVFEPGMGYVALSRVRTLNGLKLMNLNEMALKVNPSILQYDKILKENSLQIAIYLNKLSEEEKINLQKQVLFERFDGYVDDIYEENSLRERIDKPARDRQIREKKEKKPLTHVTTLGLLREKAPLIDIASQRGLTINTIIGHIEKLKSQKHITLNDISYLKETLTEADFANIMEEFKNSSDGKLRPIYDKFEGRHSFETLHIVRLFVN